MNDLFFRTFDLVHPAVDIFEHQDGLDLLYEIPGVDPADVDLNVENGVLTVSGEKRFSSEGTGLRTERAYGKFSRSFTLPRYADPERVEAEARNGVLRIRVPKREETRPRRISVRVA